MDREESLVKFKEYLQRRFPERRTAKDYVSDLHQFMTHCSKEWQEVKMQDIDHFVDQQRQKGLKPATVKRRAAAIKTFFDFLAEESGDLSWPNPVRMKRHAGKQGRRLPRDLSDEAIGRVWGRITSQRDRAWFVLMLRAGLRVGEVASLKREDILAPAHEGQPARLRVCGKGRKERIVLLSEDADAVLQTWLQERPVSSHAEVFLNERDGGPLSENGIEYCLREYARQAGIPVAPHQLRHTYARQLTEAGMPLTSLGKLMGHAQLSTTQIYTAGADPELAQIYQQTMERLTCAALPEAAESPDHNPSPPLPLVPIQERQDIELDWDAWGPDLPPAIREATLAFVKRRLPSWKAHQQQMRARMILGEYHRFWARQLKLRPIQHPAELTLRDLQAFQTLRSAEKVSAHTADYTLSLVLDLLRQLADQGIAIDPSISRFKPRPRPDSLPRHLPEYEAQRLEQHMLERLTSQDPKVRLENACYFILAHTGLRAGECLDVCMQDLDLPARRLRVRQGKGQRDRIVYLSNIACRALQLYLEASPHLPQALLLTFPDGHPISYAWLYQHLMTRAEQAGVPHVTPHRLRHTLATRLLNAGMDISRIQKLLGHEQVNTTLIYARVHDQTVEADYRRAMQHIERQQMPLSTTPIPAMDWLGKSNVNVQIDETLDNSV
jgi:site-specific recombinase XerD